MFWISYFEWLSVQVSVGVTEIAIFSTGGEPKLEKLLKAYRMQCLNFSKYLLPTYSKIKNKIKQIKIEDFGFQKGKIQ